MRPTVTATALAIATLATSVPAQIVPLGFSGGFVVQAGPTSFQTLPGTDITTGAHLVVGGPPGDAQFHFSPSWNTAAVDLLWVVSSSAYVQTSTSSGGATRHEFWSARPVTGHFVITWVPTLAGTGTASFGFDLFDDGIIEATTSMVIPITLPAGLTTLRVHTSTSAAAGVINGPWNTQIPYQGTARGVLRVRFEPTHCTVATFGAACGGAAATVVGNFLGGVDLTALGASGDDIAIAVLGFDQLSTGLPLLPGCSLYTTPVASLWRSLGPTNEVTWSITLPVGIGPVSFAAQAVALDVDTWSATTSQAFWISCQ